LVRTLSAPLREFEVHDQRERPLTATGGGGIVAR
jgi:hypothetical protein